MMIAIIPIMRPATRPGCEKNPPSGVGSGVTIEGAVGTGVKELVVIPSEGEMVGLDVGGGVVVDDEVELDVELDDVVVDEDAVCTKHEYTATYGEPQNKATQSHTPPPPTSKQ